MKMHNELLYHYFDDDDFLIVSNKIKEMEKITAGEIRVAIKEKRKFGDRKKSVRELSEMEFHKLGMSQTRDKTGILIYVLLEDRKFYILADAGINAKVEATTWDEVRDEMQAAFMSGQYVEGIVKCIDRVGKILGEHFPIKADDTNELSNKVVLE